MSDAVLQTNPKCGTCGGPTKSPHSTTCLTCYKEYYRYGPKTNIPRSRTNSYQRAMDRWKPSAKQNAGILQALIAKRDSLRDQLIPIEMEYQRLLNIKTEMDASITAFERVIRICESEAGDGDRGGPSD